MFLKQSTAVTLPFGPFVDKGDGVTEETGLSSQTGRIFKVGSAAAFTPASWAHDADGDYLVGLSTGHTDTLGHLRIAFKDPATYLPVYRNFQVLAANVYDSLVGGGDRLQVDVREKGASTLGLTAKEKAEIHADRVVDKTTDPAAWRVKIKEAGTETVIGTKLLKDVDGAAVADTDTIVGQEVQA